MMGWRARLGFLVPQGDRFADAASASHAGTGPWQSGLVQCHGHDVAGLACSPGTPCHQRLWPPAGHALSGRGAVERRKRYVTHRCGCLCALRGDDF